MTSHFYIFNAFWHAGEPFSLCWYKLVFLRSFFAVKCIAINYNIWCGWWHFMYYICLYLNVRYSIMSEWQYVDSNMYKWWAALCWWSAVLSDQVSVWWFSWLRRLFRWSRLCWSAGRLWWWWVLLSARQWMPSRLVSMWWRSRLSWWFRWVWLCVR